MTLQFISFERKHLSLFMQIKLSNTGQESEVIIRKGFCLFILIYLFFGQSHLSSFWQRWIFFYNLCLLKLNFAKDLPISFCTRWHEECEIRLNEYFVLSGINWSWFGMRGELKIILPLLVKATPTSKLSSWEQGIQILLQVICFVIVWSLVWKTTENLLHWCVRRL